MGAGDVFEGAESSLEPLTALLAMIGILGRKVLRFIRTGSKRGCALREQGSPYTVLIVRTVGGNPLNADSFVAQQVCARHAGCTAWRRDAAERPTKDINESGDPRYPTTTRAAQGSGSRSRLRHQCWDGHQWSAVDLTSSRDPAVLKQRCQLGQ